MTQSRTKNTSRNIVWGIVNKLITLLFPFLIRTAILKILGSEYLGLSSLFTSILQVLNLAELGFSSAVVFSMYKPLADNDEATVCALMNLYRKVYTIIGICILSIGILLIPFLDRLISGSHPADVQLAVLYIIYLVNTTLTYFLFAYKKSILVAAQRNDIVSNIASAVHIIMYCSQIVVLAFTKNYYYYAVLLPIFTVVDNLIANYMANKMFPQFKCHGELDDEIKQDIKKRIAGIMFGKICGTTRNSFDSLFISMFIGLNAVAIYGNYYYIMSGVQGILTTITVAMKASIGNSIATESIEKNHNDMMNFTFIYMWIAGWASVCILCLIQPFMRMWVGTKLMFSDGITVAFVVYFYTLAIGDVRNMYVEATGIWWEQRYRAIMEAIANLVLNAILVQYLGVLGIIIATLISLIVFNVIYGSQIIYQYYFTKQRVIRYYLYHLFYATITGVACVISYGICSYLTVDGIMGFFIKLCICCVIPNTVYFICYCRMEEFSAMLIYVKRIVARKF